MGCVIKLNNIKNIYKLLRKDIFDFPYKIEVGF